MALVEKGHEVDDEKLLYTKSIDEFLALFDGAKLGTGSKLTITNAQETISIRCVVYWEGTFLSKAVAKDVEKSNLVTLTVKAACASHVLGQNLFELPAVEATCAHDGNIAYYKCNVCGHCYTDANAVYATTEDACKLAQELTSTGAVITAVASSENAIGYASLSAVEGQAGIKAVTVDGVTCSEETVLDGTYKIQRPFNMVLSEANAPSDLVQAFIDFCTSAEAAELIRSAGAVPLA